jgi:hypothetical protein
MGGRSAVSGQPEPTFSAERLALGLVLAGPFFERAGLVFAPLNRGRVLIRGEPTAGNLLFAGS